MSAPASFVGYRNSKADIEMAERFVVREVTKYGPIAHYILNAKVVANVEEVAKDRAKALAATGKQVEVIRWSPVDLTQVSFAVDNKPATVTVLQPKATRTTKAAPEAVTAPSTALQPTVYTSPDPKADWDSCSKQAFPTLAAAKKAGKAASVGLGMYAWVCDSNDDVVAEFTPKED